MAKQTIEIDVPEGKWNAEVKSVHYCGVYNETERRLRVEVTLRPIPPQPRYIPFTAETFRPHRDRWVRIKGSTSERRVLEWISDGINRSVNVYGVWMNYCELFNSYEFINPDGSTEPCGQKVEG